MRFVYYLILIFRRNVSNLSSSDRGDRSSTSLRKAGATVLGLTWGQPITGKKKQLARVLSGSVPCEPAAGGHR